MCEIEASLSTQGDAPEKPTLSEVADCVKKLYNTTALGEDGITSPLLKECFTAIYRLHQVILVIWRSGRAPIAWKCAIVVPLHKGKGTQQCSNNYRKISLFSIPGKVYSMVLMHMVS